jgi:hypothetical protein
MKKGDKVRILRQDISGINCPYGVVTSVDGGLVFMRSERENPLL